MATDRLVIRRQRHPWRALVLALAALGILAGAILGAYRFGVDQGVGAAAGAVGERADLQRRVRSMSEKLAALRVDVARLESTQRIDREAYDKVRANLGRVQQENLELREELQFYRNIVAPSQSAPGLQVQRFALEPAVGPGQYRYRLTLIHVQGAKNRQSVARGRIDLYVDGTIKERSRRLSLAELVASGSTELTYSIRYFKTFEGELRLPEGFEPRSAVVEVVPRGDTQPALEKRIRWPGAPTG